MHLTNERRFHIDMSVISFKKKKRIFYLSKENDSPIQKPINTRKGKLGKNAGLNNRIITICSNSTHAIFITCYFKIAI